MKDKTNPALDELVASVVTVIYRRYRQFVERPDLTQEAWAFVYTRTSQFNELLEVDNEVQRKWNEKRVAWQIKRNLERYSRKEKAAKSGYQVGDEAYYDTVTIGQLLPFVIKSAVLDTSLEQSQILVNDGTPKKPSAPSEGGNLLAMLVDIKKAYELLEKNDQEILRMRYYDNLTLQQIGEYYEVHVSTADRRCTQAVRRLQNNIGGESPWQ